jgi:hypothetical protein
LLDEKGSLFRFGKRGFSRRIEVRIHSDKLTLEEQCELVQVRALQFLAKLFKRSDIRVEDMRLDIVVCFAACMD